MQIANVSSTLGSIGDKAKYMKDDDARKAMPFAAKIPAYKMSKVGSALHPSRCCLHGISSDPVFGPAHWHQFNTWIHTALPSGSMRDPYPMCGGMPHISSCLVPFVIALSLCIAAKIQSSKGEDMCTLQAALNMLTMSLAADLKDDGITVICYCPGW